MDYAVVESGGKQYKVNKGSIVDVSNLDLNKDDTVTFDKVLLFVSDGTIKIGKPYLSGITVTGKVLDNFKGDKVRVSKFKAKSRYRKVYGHRDQLTKVEINTVEAQKKAAKAEK